ncbi:SGNH/GDSL hydrolase family protein [Telmatobacter sp. DSM 110680]|uniref:SGNH/GDSL hydrolase family protein n=1 Tax=Telmatobacter sp. DSM 110680 TaxID=3036704 RepID=A0AAU7DM09_9BACT
MQTAQRCKPAHVCAKAQLPLASPRSTRNFSFSTAFLCLFSAVLISLSPVGVHAQPGPPTPEFTKIIVFGDSLSDTGNVAHLTYDKYGFRVPGPVADYTDGSFTDGFDTAPAAQLYSGVWIKQLADSMPSKPEVNNSLDGGTNYAFGYATTGMGTGSFTFGAGDVFSVDVENIGQQITDYLATKPKITPKTLFVVWGGANDFIHGGVSVQTAYTVATNQYANIQALIDAGATQFIVPNLPPLGLIPRINGDPATAGLVNLVVAYYNGLLNADIQLLRKNNPRKHLQIAQLDVFGLFNSIVAAPSNYAFANVTGSSQGIPVNPDTYLFWDDLHPTTHGHNILAINAAAILARSNCMNASKNGNGPVGTGAYTCGGMQ